jgi:hypothetical protein
LRSPRLSTRKLLARRPSRLIFEHRLALHIQSLYSPCGCGVESLAPREPSTSRAVQVPAPPGRLAFCARSEIGPPGCPRASADGSTRLQAPIFLHRSRRWSMLKSLFGCASLTAGRQFWTNVPFLAAVFCAPSIRLLFPQLLWRVALSLRLWHRPAFLPVRGHSAAGVEQTPPSLLRRRLAFCAHLWLTTLSSNKFFLWAAADAVG